MALVQPSFILPVTALVKEQALTYKFNFGIGNTSIVQSSKINIYDNPSSTTPIATSVYNSTLNEHIIQPDVTSKLTIQNQYYISIQTYTQMGATGIESPESSRITVWCLNLPELTITTPTSNEDLTVSSFVAEALFTTGVTDYTLGIGNKLNQYIFELKQGTSVIYTSDNIIGEGTAVSESTDNTQFTISYNFVGVNNGTYTLVVTGITSENITIVAATTFNVNVDISEFKTAQVTNNSCEGYINIECNINNIEGETNGIPHNEGWVQLRDLPDNINGYVKWDSGYNFPTDKVGNNNWTFQIWGFNFNSSSYVNPQLGSNGVNQDVSYIVQLRTIEYETSIINGELDIYLVKTIDNMVQAELYVYPNAQKDYNISTCIKSNKIPVPKDGTNLLDSEQVSIWLRSLNGYYELFIRNITSNNPPITVTTVELESEEVA